MEPPLKVRINRIDIFCFLPIEVFEVKHFVGFFGLFFLTLIIFYILPYLAQYYILLII